MQSSTFSRPRNIISYYPYIICLISIGYIFYFLSAENLMYHNENESGVSPGDGVVPATLTMGGPARIDMRGGSGRGRFSPGRVFVSVSSDDWGRWTDAVCIWPDRQTMLKWNQRDNGIYKTDHDTWQYAAAETKGDILRFFDFMDNINAGQSNCHRVVITPFWVVAGPDIVAMKRNGCPSSPSCKYEEMWIHNSTGGLAYPPFRRGDLRPLYKQAFLNKYLHPEYHSRSHMSVKKYMASLLNNDKTQTLFNEGYACTDPALTHTYLRSEVTDYPKERDLFEWVRQGVESFETFWGYRPMVATMPHAVDNENLGSVLYNLGFIGVDQVDVGGHTKKLSRITRQRIDAYYDKYDLSQHLNDLKKAMDDSNHPFVSLMWHTQNILSSTYDHDTHQRVIDSFNSTVSFVRRSYPGAVFVTSSELHQIRERGWSMEVWADHIVIRNYNRYRVAVKIPELGFLFPGHSAKRRWAGRELEVLTETDEMDKKTGHMKTVRTTLPWPVRSGDTVVMEPDTTSTVRLRRRPGSTEYEIERPTNDRHGWDGVRTELPGHDYDDSLPEIRAVRSKKRWETLSREEPTDKNIEKWFSESVAETEASKKSSSFE